MGKVAVFTLVLTGLLGTGYHCVTPPNNVLITSSPDSVYKVQLRTESSAAEVLLGETMVYFDADTHDRKWLKRQRLISYDGWINFLDKYPSYQWVNNSILHFRGEAGTNVKGSETIHISNNSNKKVSYLRIYSFDIFLLFDITPGATAEVEIPFYEGLSWVESNGQFEDGSTIALEGVNFNRNKRSLETPAYCISIEDNRVRVSSTQIEGWNSREKGIPISNRCKLGF